LAVFPGSWSLRAGRLEALGLGDARRRLRLAGPTCSLGRPLDWIVYANRGATARPRRPGRAQLGSGKNRGFTTMALERIMVLGRAHPRAHDFCYLLDAPAGRSPACVGDLGRPTGGIQSANLPHFNMPAAYRLGWDGGACSFRDGLSATNGGCYGFSTPAR